MEPQNITASSSHNSRQQPTSADNRAAFDEATAKSRASDQEDDDISWKQGGLLTGFLFTAAAIAAALL